MKVVNWAFTIYAPDGTIVGSWLDTNGNYFQYEGSPLAMTDSAGRRIGLIAAYVGNCDGNSNKYCYDLPNSQGGTSRYTITTQTINVNTSFGQSGITEYSGTITVIQSLGLPDGTSYQFGYDSGTSSGHYGLLTSMTLPTGAQITYAYTTFSDAYGKKYRWVNSRTTPDGTWTYTPATISTCTSSEVNCQQKYTVTAPSYESRTDETVYTSTLNGGAWLTEVNSYNGTTSGTLLSTISQCFSFVTVTNGTCSYSKTTASPATLVRLVTRTTTLPISSGSLSATTKYTWDSYGNNTKIEEWNFGNAPSGAANRTTDISYLGGSYITKNILNRPSTVTVTGGGATVAQTIFSYDQGSLTSETGKKNHDNDTNFGTGNTVRGNVTQVQNLVSGTSTYLSMSATYDMTGQIRSITDPASNTTNLTYADSFFTDAGNSSNPSSYSPSTPTNTYLTSIDPPVLAASTFGYYWGTGQQARVTDVNSKTTDSHFYDSLNRHTSTKLPNNGWDSIQPIRVPPRRTPAQELRVQVFRPVVPAHQATAGVIGKKSLTPSDA